MYIKLNADTKPKLALDIDGTLGAIDAAILQFLNSPYKSSDITAYNVIYDLVGEDNFWSSYYYLWSRRNDLILLIEEDAPETVEKLLEKYDISYVTKRPESLREGTLKWLYKINKFPELELVCVPKGVHKVSLDYQIYVDDNELAVPDFENVERKFLYLFNQPWNENINITNSINIKRIYSLKDLFELQKKTQNL